MSEDYGYVFKTNKKVSLSFTDTYKSLGFASKKNSRVGRCRDEIRLAMC